MADCVLPDDIIIRSILKLLPVKSILRFKSVCKPWLHLFSTPEFAKLHHAQLSSDPQNECFVIDLFSSISLLKVEPSTIVDLPWSDNVRGWGTVGCCNGLICIGRRVGKTVILWNPATKLFKNIGLISRHDVHPFLKWSLGFVYDDEADDYKLIRIVASQVGVLGDLDLGRIEVYSVNSDSWITIDPGFKFLSKNDTHDVTVNGNPYWVATVFEDVSACNNSSYDVLVCFDVKKMVFRTVPLFKPMVDEDAKFVDWNGCLGALVCALDKDERVVESIDVWVFDEAGEQIWRKNHTFEAPIEMKVSEYRKWQLLSSKNGKIVVMCPDDGQKYVFDSVVGTIKKVGIAGPYPKEVYPYTESLAYIEGMKPEGDR